MATIFHLPWDCHADLTQERIIALAQLFADVRHETLLDYDEVKGDGPWSHGCRVYERIIKKLADKARSGEWPWFALLSSLYPLECRFKIGEIPAGFYQGLPNKPNHRTLGCTHSELRQLSLLFDKKIPSIIKWRFATETGNDGKISIITLVGYNEFNEIVSSWEVPVIPFNLTLVNVTAPPEPPIEQPPPIVTIPLQGKKWVEKNDN